MSRPHPGPAPVRPRPGVGPAGERPAVRRSGYHFALCAAVAARLREQESLCRTVQLEVRYTSLLWCERQARPDRPACNSTDLFGAAFGLYRNNRTPKPVRSLSVRASGLSPAGDGSQLSLFPEERRSLCHRDLRRAMDHIRGKLRLSQHPPRRGSHRPGPKSRLATYRIAKVMRREGYVWLSSTSKQYRQDHLWR